MKFLIHKLVNEWKLNGLPSRQGLKHTVDELHRRKQTHTYQALWQQPPKMVTATIDDGMGHGLEIIHWFAAVCDMHLIGLGLLRKPDEIIQACKVHEPELLGLTVLQFDSEDDLILIRKKIPKKTVIIAGGPVFKIDSAFQKYCGIDYVFKDVAVFLEFLLDYTP